jgi:hypothetical protein
VLVTAVPQVVMNPDQQVSIEPGTLSDAPDEEHASAEQG